jgi:8-amino-7-oxononanoate synthase
MSAVDDSPNPLGWLAQRSHERSLNGLLRRLPDTSSSHPQPTPPIVDLASNDYLRLSRHPLVCGAASDAALAWGVGATGSRLVTGSTELHAVLEADLASFLGAEAALVFSSGYLANIGVITALVGRGDLVVSDRYNHASVVDACRLSRARVVVTNHGDLTSIDETLAQRSEKKALVVVEAIYSVDGDPAPIAELSTLCRRRGAVLVVDEAHAMGVVGPGGRGGVAAAGLTTATDIVRTLTLSKALGSQGGAVIGSRMVVNHVIDTARAFMFDTALAPPSVAAARSSLAVLSNHPHWSTTVHDRAVALAAIATEMGLLASPPASAVTSIRIGDSQAALAAAMTLQQAGVRVGCFRPPSVPDRHSRLRIAAHLGLDDEAIEVFRSAVATLATSPDIRC